MATGITVPADFGIENLHCEFHGNVTLNLKDGNHMKANSLILSYNSPVFNHLFRNLYQSVVEMDDFEEIAVRCFIESLYVGRITLEKSLFREIIKMSHVFDVSWLMTRCRVYFKTAVENFAEEGPDHFSFVVQEAVFAKYVLKNNDLHDTAKRSCLLINSTKMKLFIKTYMKDLHSLSNNEMDFIIEIAANQYETIIEVIICNIECTGMVLEENSKYLLQRINLSACLKYNSKLYYNLFSMLTEDLKGATMDDIKLIMSLNMSSTKKYVVDIERDSIVSKNIPNLFHPFHEFVNISGFDRFFEMLSSSPEVVSLYMFLEGITKYLRSCDNNAADFLKHVTEFQGKLDQVIAVQRSRGWDKISLEFFDTSLFEYSQKGTVHNCDMFLKDIEDPHNDTKLIFNRSQLCSEYSTKISCPGSFKMYNFLTEEKKYTFLAHHTCAGCSNSNKSCGFLLKVSPAVKDDPDSFDIELCVDPCEYDDSNIHIHPDVLKAKNTHLVLERLEVDGSWSNKGMLSWRTKPLIGNGGYAHWSKYRYSSSCKNTYRLVMYYSVQ